MATANLSEMVTRLAGRLPGGAGPDVLDDDLVARFAATRDESAFAELVRRHGGTVFGVCRRVTGNHHLAEDAFQAVFVVLAAKAATIRPRHAVAAWLYGVAFRTSLRARTMSGRRRRREATVETLPEPAGAPPAGSADVVAIIDEEVAALPEHYRLAVVLCELEGRGRAEVARQLGVPEGTLSSRLAAARKALAGRLRNRGVALSAAGVSLVLGQIASASVPAGLAVRATAAVSAPGSVSAPVAALSYGVMRIMFLHKLKAVVPLAGLLAVAVLGGGLLAGGSPAGSAPATAPKRVALVEVPKPQPPARAVPAVPVVAGPNKLLFYRAGHLTLIDPDGKNDKKVSEDRGMFHPGESRLSPDGKTLAVLIQEQKPGDPNANEQTRRKLYIRALDEKEPGTDLGVECQTFVWSPDGTEIVGSTFSDQPREKGPPDVTNFVVNVKTKEKTTLKLPVNHIVTDWSRDGKHFVTTSQNLTAERPTVGINLMNRDGSEHKRLTDEKTLAALGKLSADGKRLVFSRIDPATKDKTGPAKRDLAVLDIATGKVTKVEDLPLNGSLQDYCWSPDGKKLAYTWREVHEGKPEDLIDKETESFLVICDPDGKNAKTIATEKGQGQWRITLAYVDWR